MRAFLFVVSAVLVGGLVPGGPVAAQGTVATYSKEAMDELAGLLKKASRDGFVMEPATTTIFGGWLPRGRGQGNEPWLSVLVLTNLDPNKTYRIIAAGDNDVKDLDLRILDPNNNVVAVDAGAARNAEVTFRPTRRQNYVIQMRLFDSRDNSICIGAVMAK